MNSIKTNQHTYDKQLQTRKIQTKITKLFNIQHPIILPGMSWISTPELVAAVSNAGGLGILAMGPLSPKETEESIQKIRSLTNKPFGVGCTLMMPGAKENAEVALDLKVPVINFSLGKGEWIVKAAHEYGGKVLATVVNKKHAKSALDVGADALMVTGHEAAAHGGDVTTLVLIPSITSYVKNELQRNDVPIIAAGGFANGRGLLAALSLGADGIAMGSRLATSLESPLHPNIKNHIITKDETDTLYSSNYDGIPARVMKSNKTIHLTKHRPNILQVAIRAIQASKTFNVPIYKIIPGLIADYKKIYMLAQFGAATKQFMGATMDGDLEEGVQFIGQSQGLIGDIVSVEDIINRCVLEAEGVYKDLDHVM